MMSLTAHGQRKVGIPGLEQESHRTQFPQASFPGPEGAVEVHSVVSGALAQRGVKRRDSGKSSTATLM